MDNILLTVAIMLTGGVIYYAGYWSGRRAEQKIWLDRSKRVVAQIDALTERLEGNRA